MASFYVTAWSKCPDAKDCEQTFQSRGVYCKVGDTLIRDFQDGFNSCVPPTPASHRSCALPSNYTAARVPVLPPRATCEKDKCSLLEMKDVATNCCEYNVWALLIVCAVAVFVALAILFLLREITTRLHERRVYDVEQKYAERRQASQRRKRWLNIRNL